MNLKSKNTGLIILGITALIFSRIMFVFFNDPEGPNLLIVMVTAIVVYFLSLSAYLLNFPNTKKFLYSIFIQILTVAVLYFCFK